MTLDGYKYRTPGFRKCSKTRSFTLQVRRLRRVILEGLSHFLPLLKPQCRTQTAAKLMARLWLPSVMRPHHSHLQMRADLTLIMSVQALLILLTAPLNGSATVNSFKSCSLTGSFSALPCFLRSSSFISSILCESCVIFCRGLDCAT